MSEIPYHQIGGLSRAQRKRLLAMACAGDRLEWKLYVRRRTTNGTHSATSRIAHLVGESLEWLPALSGATRLGRNLNRWRRRFLWAKALFGFFL